MEIVSLTLVVLLFGLLASGLWIGPALIVVGVLMAWLFSGIPVEKLLPQYTYNIFTTADLISLPLYILMGEILFRTRLSSALFSGLAPWTGKLPGRLLHINVLASTIFASISGSSAATTQVVGKMSLMELLRRGYAPGISMGSLAGAGTLGFLIPPSTVMILYGVLANESILRLFAAGLIPGLLLAACFMAWIMIHSTVKPEIVPESERALSRLPLGQRLAALRELIPVVFLIICVLGSMYGGLATPSEAAALGVLGALIISGQQGMLNAKVLREIVLGAVQTSCVLGLIILGATVLGNINSFLGVPDYLTQLVDGLNLSPFGLILVLLLLYVALGTVLEGFSIIVTTLPVVLPLVVAAGFDPIWFGVFLVVVVEMAQITPPVAFNFLVIQSMTGTSSTKLAIATIPYFLLMAGFVMLIAIFPQIVLWLPTVLYG